MITRPSPLRYESSSVLKGSLDASLAANLPASPETGDRYKISVIGTFENDASILPVGSNFTIGDQIEWAGDYWYKLEAGDIITDPVVQNYIKQQAIKYAIALGG